MAEVLTFARWTKTWIDIVFFSVFDILISYREKIHCNRTETKIKLIFWVVNL